MTDELTIEAIIGIALGAAGILSPFVYKGIRYIITKDKCLTLLKDRIEKQEEETKAGKATHGDLYEKIEEISTSQAVTDGKLDLILNHFNLNPNK